MTIASSPKRSRSVSVAARAGLRVPTSLSTPASGARRDASANPATASTAVTASTSPGRRLASAAAL